MLRKPRLALVRECIPNAKRVALMRHLANPALNLQVEASNAAAPELAGVVVPHTASIQMHAAQNQIFGLVLAHPGRLLRCNNSVRFRRNFVRAGETAGMPLRDFSHNQDPMRTCSTRTHCDAAIATTAACKTLVSWLRAQMVSGSPRVIE